MYASANLGVRQFPFLNAIKDVSDRIYGADL